MILSVLKIITAVLLKFGLLFLLCLAAFGALSDYKVKVSGNLSRNQEYWLESNQTLAQFLTKLAETFSCIKARNITLRYHCKKIDGRDEAINRDRTLLSWLKDCNPSLNESKDTAEIKFSVYSEVFTSQKSSSVIIPPCSFLRSRFLHSLDC